MEYTDNPRKVYAKIRIVYSDSEISKELSVETSGNGAISFPMQTYKGYISPTIKACTMDGNSMMGGGFQMNDVGLITGWWSDCHCDDNGVFSNPPWLATSFIARPVISWTVIGDSKLGQYPVDFTITAYRGEEIFHIVDVVGNAEISRRIAFEPPLEDITKIQITVQKWSAPNAKVKLLQFFDILEEEYSGSDLIDFEVLEELSSSSESAGYGINSDTASFTLYNKDRKFDKGYLRSLLLLNRKVIPYIGIERDGEIDYTKLGTFYSDEWTVPQTDITVKLKCVDKLMSLQLVTYIGFPFTAGTNLYAITENILQTAGLDSSQYVIDESLKEDVLYSGYLRKSNCWEALQEVCYGGLCYAYCDRDDRIVIIKDTARITDMQIAANSITAYERKTTMTDFSNYIEVDYTEATESAELTVASESMITVGPKERLTIVADYATEISSSSLSFLPSVGLEIVSFESGVNAGKFTVYNSTDAAITTTATIKGHSLSITKQTVVTQDEESIKQWGRQEYKYTGSELIQSYGKAVEMGEKLMAELGQGNGRISITWRGNPKLKLQDTVRIFDRFGDGDIYVAEFNRFKYDGGLKEETKGRIIHDGMERT